MDATSNFRFRLWVSNAVFGVSLLWMAGHPGLARAQDAAPVGTTVSRADQASRDSERLQILRAELAKTQQDIADLTRRLTERNAAGDATGAQELSDRLTRSQLDIAGLQREIRAVEGRPTDARVPAQRAPVPSSKSGSADPNKPAAPPAWWDIYSRPGPSAGAAAARTLAAPAASTAAAVRVRPANVDQ
jgi:hypothetical protein